jgi:hypothetical protein
VLSAALAYLLAGPPAMGCSSGARLLDPRVIISRWLIPLLLPMLGVTLGTGVRLSSSGGDRLSAFSAVLPGGQDRLSFATRWEAFAVFYLRLATGEGVLASRSDKERAAPVQKHLLPTPAGLLRPVVAPRFSSERVVTISDRGADAGWQIMEG